MNTVFDISKQMKMGLGDAVKRLNNLHSRKGRGLASKEERAEHDLLLEALNEIKIDLGFDCNSDGVPDSVDIFAKTASTGCCRLLPSTPSRRKRTSSRRKK